MYYIFECNCIGIMTINSEYKGTIVTMTRLYCRLEDSPFAGDLVIFKRSQNHAEIGNKAFTTADYLRSLYCTYLDDWFLL